MTEEQILAKLEEFAEEIFACRSFEMAFDIKRRLDKFEKDHNVTFEQFQPFAQSGAGEVLDMLTTAPIAQ